MTVNDQMALLKKNPTRLAAKYMPAGGKGSPNRCSSFHPWGVRRLPKGKWIFRSQWKGDSVSRQAR